MITEQVGPSRATIRYTMRETRSVTQSEWDGWLETCPGGGHIYQSYEWGEFKRSIGWKPVRLVLERDGEVVGLGQFLVYHTPFIPGTLMYCTKGPWLPWEDEEAVDTFFKGVRTAAARERAHTVKIEPEVLEQQSDVKSHLAEIGFRKARWDLQFKTTMIVDLSPLEEELLKRMREKTRYNIRLADRKGVEIVEDNSDEGRDAFYEMGLMTARRNGVVIRRSYEYYKKVWQAMNAAGRSHLFFATQQGERLAGMIVHTFGKKYWYMAGASTSEKRNLMPTYLLQWEVMRWAKRQGITYYDMVAIPNPENLDDENDSMHGLYKFKVGFGGEVAEFLGCLDLPLKRVPAKAWYHFEPVYYRLYQKLKHNIFY